MILYNKNEETFSIYTNFTPSHIDEHCVEITQAQYDEYQDKVSQFYIPTYHEDTNTFTYELDEDAKKEAHLVELRTKRKPELTAFDIYKTNVSYSTVVEDEATHTLVVDWYTKVLDLNEDAINNVPDVVAKYL